jgi:glutamyl-tRNA synthetase
MNEVRTRFAPSPTGHLHIGSLRTALYAYALAKHSEGDFILRIEDTDQKRTVEGATDSLKETLEKFGLVWDEFYIQSERHKSGIYKEAAEKLVSSGNAFYCECQSKNAKEEGFSKDLRDPCREKGLSSGAIKLKVPENKKVSYMDFVHQKEISWKTDDVYDATLLKTDGFPTYHLAAMVDDLDMKVSHILRGHDWLPSTPIHLLVFEYLGGERPEIGHLTDILSAETGKKLSKRRDSVFVEQFLEEGILPEALLNFVMLLGWAPKDNRELFTLDEFVKNFDIKGFGQANPKFLSNKMLWMDQQYIQSLDHGDLAKRINEFFGNKYPLETISKIVPLINTRIKTIKEFEDIAGFIFSEVEIDKSLFNDDFAKHIESALSVLEDLDDFSKEKIDEVLMEEVKKNDYHTGKFFMDMRIALTGKKVTPPMSESMVILGKEETVKRLRNSLSS